MTVETMFSHGTQVWRGRGVCLDHPPSAEEAIREAGLDWEVETVEASALGLPIPRARAVVRKDRREPLGIAGTGFRPIQNRDAFRFMDRLIGEGRAFYETAGSLDRGRKVWLLARLPEDVWVTRMDNVRKYVLLLNAHFRGKSCVALLTGIRAACENMIRAALREAKERVVRIRHVGDIEGQALEAQRLLGISLKYYDAFGEQARHFAARQLREEMVRRYFEEIIPDPKTGDPARAMATRDTLAHLFEAGRGNDLPGTRGTLWAAFNAVAEFVDYERPTRIKKGESEEMKRFESALLGSGAALKERAWSRALALL